MMDTNTLIIANIYELWGTLHSSLSLISIALVKVNFLN